jgi:hypothetical protein
VEQGNGMINISSDVLDFATNLHVQVWRALRHNLDGWGVIGQALTESHE